MRLALLDTDIVSEVIKLRNVAVRQRALEYITEHGELTFSVITRYEITRGYKDRKAPTQLARFALFCQHSVVLPVTDTIFERAADLWALARQGGHPRNDADLLIAATALEQSRDLITGNTAHFNWIPGLHVEDWRT